jgi:hypothetical protein
MPQHLNLLCLDWLDKPFRLLLTRLAHFCAAVLESSDTHRQDLTLQPSQTCPDAHTSKPPAEQAKRKIDTP